jgi:putative tricarboxylic transport membrane protein
MSDLIANLELGFSVALSLRNVGLAFVGCMVGTLIGVLPGVGPIATITMLLPITFGLPPVGALIMLAGIYYGAQYGGSTTAILVNLPGEASSVVTCIDGYQMARQGRAGPALAIAAIGSFIAGTVCTLICAVLAAPLAAVATQFGPAEYFSLMVLGLIGAVVIAHRSVLKAIGMVIVGLILGLVGIDVNSGAQRFVFGVTELYDGIGFIVVAVGVFAISEIVTNLEQKEKREVFTGKVTGCRCLAHPISARRSPHRLLPAASGASADRSPHRAPPAASGLRATPRSGCRRRSCRLPARPALGC